MNNAAEILAELRRQGVAPCGIRADSRRIGPDEVFVALPGARSDGRAHIAEAVAQGAVAVLWEREGADVDVDADADSYRTQLAGVPSMAVTNLKAVVGALADEIYGQPSGALWVCGITGTNGKTSVSQWIAQALNHAGRCCGVIGTLGNGLPGALQASANTTPDAPSIHAELAGMRAAGADACAMEVSSIGLDQRRVDAVHFDTVVLTNLTRDHLDYHGNMIDYATAKARLFDLPGIRTAVLNLDDPLGPVLAGHLAGRGVRRIGYTLEENSPHAGCVDEVLSVRALNIGGQGLRLTVVTAHGEFVIDSALLGRFNAANLLAVFGALLGAGLAPGGIVAALGCLTPPPGRMQIVPAGAADGAADETPLPVVDYAHTPDALEQALRTLREVATARGGRLFCVFGCGGERDPGKRPLMGRTAERLADVVIVTSDNPRGEAPPAIFHDILSGMRPGVPVEADRAAAIQQALQRMQAADVLLIAGKGHEAYQEIAGQRLPFSDLEQTQVALLAWQTRGSMMSLQAAAAACAGRLIEANTTGAYRFSGVSTDTRSIAPGDLFVALRGATFDGHDFVEAALAQGAAGVLVDEGWLAAQPRAVHGWPLLVVAETRHALGQLAAAWRRRFELPLIGVTGSNGKTTVKEMCAAILRAQAQREGFDPATAVLATVGNLNNDIGLPLMLLRLRTHHRAAVIEMGMNHPGEIDILTRIAAPTVALVNNAQRAHLEGLGSLAAVARAKGEIFAGLLPGGVAVFNAEDGHAALWRELAQQVGVTRLVDFGLAVDEIQADIRATCQPLRYGSRIELKTPQGAASIELQVPGLHNVRNALAAAAATLAAGACLADVASGLAAYAGVKGRLQRRNGEAGALVIDDSYNANPDSMRAAIDVLAALPGRRIFVLGDMGEVGERSGQFHDEIGGYAKSMGVDCLLALGEHAAAAVRNFGAGATHFKSVEALVGALRPLLDAQTTVLVKGSRFMKMERVADAISQAAAPVSVRAGDI
ncbi:MAG: bifunctional UDP-N-acetylmuramoyl-L-alanyl-D-glutamate--2,6-diaminopimelate ligase MurE/UDP-N-acetylmuramoyl-tripeptide--D-alanyl-D-alanine ligase MurF [Sterolibacterium sp.]|nr:bifunctional UDP-N-acetylmuramoyl-L-alanyl-D-glutamate--2,6-diaminopimelate ligase MurE/UDP-N-acetylmuramoyl-tripeptide--D-alanyl-D-alanine ligase MurF [Sterolibacterium sp.]MBP9800446.1 bifunctional UDP-N-acetylmuramoyl-L-alanyl-D-glutamate--2,6-diaminopimelate ligase MurE/UDP-N-acetylmuramoyl-tripeptide--D-alanyl-D-alanine ligase MurF [Sterolibacterium sp.]